MSKKSPSTSTSSSSSTSTRSSTSLVKSNSSIVVDTQDPYIVDGYVNNYGFCVKKNKIAPVIYSIIKKHFHVKPDEYINPDEIEDETKYFDVYYEDEKYIVLPKFSEKISIMVSKYYSEQNVQIDNKYYCKIVFRVVKIKYKKECVKFNFKGKLRDYQMQIINTILEKFNYDPSIDFEKQPHHPNGGIIKLSCGGGKCLGYNTPILMYDGSIKMVQDVKVGDMLMGDDSNFRTVYTITRGTDIMYKIIQSNGTGFDYIVNSSHILSLYDVRDGCIYDIEIGDYLKLDTEEREFLHGCRTNVKFPYDHNIGTDLVVQNIAQNHDWDKIKYYIQSHWKTQYLLIKGIFSNTFILNNLSMDGFTCVLFLLNSLGIDYTFCIETHSVELKTVDILDKPFVFEYKITHWKISVELMEEADYYGFTISGNRRFLLGDFTITHNTVLAIYLSWLLGLKTLIVTHKEFLMDQWEARYIEFTDAKIGRIRQKLFDVEGKDVVIGMLRSLGVRNYPQEMMKQFGLIIYDEVHHAGSRVDSQALFKTSGQFTIGLSATPERVDGMTRVINWFIGGILHESEKKYNYRIMVKKVYFRSTDKLFKEKLRYFKGRFVPSHTVMTNNLTEIKSRNQLICDFIDVLKNMGRKILVLSCRVEHLEELKRITDKKIEDDDEAHMYNTYYYMGKTKTCEKRMAERDGHIIFATMQLAEEGLDISHLDTIILTLPVNIQKLKGEPRKKISKTLIQSIGRILRMDKLETLRQIPVVIDMSDMLSIYSKWSDKRNDIYMEKGWFVQNYYWNDLDFASGAGNTKSPLNIMFDDMTDENFIEKNLMIDECTQTQTDVKKTVVKEPVYGFGRTK